VILSTDTNVSANYALFLMASLSPKVKDMVDLELYRQTADSDASTEQYILDNGLAEFIKDIESIGITLEIDYGHMSEDLPKLFTFIHLASYLLPNSLYNLVKTDTHVQECLQHILSGSLGDNETLVQTYLSELGGLDGQLALVPDLTDILDQMYPAISQTEIFTDYIKNILDLITQEKMAVESDSESHKAYQDVIRNLVGRMSDAVNLFSRKALFAQMCQIQNIFIRDLTSPVNFIAYNYIMTNTVETLPEDLGEGYKRKWYHYHVSHPWCLEYYKLRNLVPTPAQILITYCFAYALNPSRPLYEASVVELRQMYPSAEADSAITSLYQE
jgi:hypothetical protein